MKKVLFTLSCFFVFTAFAQAQQVDPAQKVIDLLEANQVSVEVTQVAQIKTLADDTINKAYPNGGSMRNADFKQAVQTFKRAVRNDILTAEQREAFEENR